MKLEQKTKSKGILIRKITTITWLKFMFKQLNAGIVSLGLVSTMTAPVMAQDAFGTSTETQSVPTNNLLVEDYSNLYSSVPHQVEGELNTLAVKNTLDFSNINLGDRDVVALEDVDALAQRRTRTSSSKYKYSAGFDIMNFGWVKDRNGVISSILGFNLGLGVGYKKFINPKGPNSFNFGWQVGTVLLVFPIVGGFAEYQWDEGWYVGASINFFPVFAFTSSLYYPLPSLAVGYRWK